MGTDGADRGQPRADWLTARSATRSKLTSRRITEVRGRPLGAVHLITFNADGRAQHVVADHRPLSSLMCFSRLLRERVKETPYAEHFLAGDAEQT